MNSAPLNWRQPRLLIPVLVGVVGVVVLVMVLMGGGSTGSGSEAKPNAVESSSTTSTTGSSSGGEKASNTQSGPYTTPNMPVEVTASNTTSVASGTTVKIHAAPSDGSETYGVEARLCRGDAAVFNDGLFSPTMGGLCAPNPMTPDSDGYLAVVGTPPYQGIDLAFRVGVGSQTFLTQYNGNATVTCDTSHPCQIVLKLQYPKAFGFQSLPVTFS
jgi:hypothetical protein